MEERPPIDADGRHLAADPALFEVGGGFGVLLGIARREKAGDPVQLLNTADVSLTTGVARDARGLRLPNSNGKRQVSLITRTDWEAACAEAGCSLDWWISRRTLLIDGLTIVHTTGRHLRIGSAVLEITGECDPCWKMDRAAPGLQAAMRPNWRGGLTCRVIAEGSIAVGDMVILEK